MCTHAVQAKMKDALSKGLTLDMKKKYLNACSYNLRMCMTRKQKNWKKWLDNLAKLKTTLSHKQNTVQNEYCSSFVQSKKIRMLGLFSNTTWSPTWTSLCITNHGHHGILFTLFFTEIPRQDWAQPVSFFVCLFVSLFVCVCETSSAQWLRLANSSPFSKTLSGTS